MIIKKVYNNNIVLVEDEKQLEMVLIGRGIAFQKKAGDPVDAAKAEKRFVIDSPEVTSRFSELVQEVPVNHLELACRIIEDAQKELEARFCDAIYIGLADHISYALYRYKQKIPLKNRLLWEIRRFYPREFAAAKEALKTIAYYENVRLPEDEAGYIALHFVNASQAGEEMETTIRVTETVQEVLKIIQVHFNMNIEESSLNYQRLVTHIRYFAHRLFVGELVENDDDMLFEQVRAAYPRSYACVRRICGYFEKKYGTQITKEEQMYLMLHISRVAKREGS